MNKYSLLLKQMRDTLPIGESFDILERNLSIGDRDAVMFFVDGLINGEVMERVLAYLLAVSESDTASADDSETFIKQSLPYLDAMTEEDISKVIKQFYTGMVPLLIDGYDKVILLDVRQYPMRTVEEPSKEKTLRGAKDGFTETMMTNIALIRRRIRDSRLIFKNVVVGKATKTDVSLVYMKGVADEVMVEKMEKTLKSLKTETLTVGEQSLIEALTEAEYGHKKSGAFNPFPKVRYTQRPDVIAAHLTEGKLAIIVDNTPTVVLLPTGIFDFAQDIDDYYFPMITGNYFRALRVLNVLVILFLTPVYLMISEGHIPSPAAIEFFVPKEPFAIPLFWQFILLEVAIDGLKLASLNTPESLGMSLSVIGALILGEFSISSGWFIPQTILCMAVVALASFTQPSIELGYGLKYMRILMLAGIALAGYWGAAAGLLISVVLLATTKTLIGTSYLYPLIPFDGKALKRLLFRTASGHRCRRAPRNRD